MEGILSVYDGETLYLYKSLDDFVEEFPLESYLRREIQTLPPLEKVLRDYVSKIKLDGGSGIIREDFSSLEEFSESCSFLHHQEGRFSLHPSMEWLVEDFITRCSKPPAFPWNEEEKPDSDEESDSDDYSEEESEEEDYSDEESEGEEDPSQEEESDSEEDSEEDLPDLMGSDRHFTFLPWEENDYDGPSGCQLM